MLFRSLLFLRDLDRRRDGSLLAVGHEEGNESGEVASVPVQRLGDFLEAVLFRLAIRLLNEPSGQFDGIGDGLLEEIRVPVRLRLFHEGQSFLGLVHGLSSYLSKSALMCASVNPRVL